MDVLHIEQKAQEILDKHGDKAEEYVQHHLDEARVVGLKGATHDWEAIQVALRELLEKPAL